MDTSLIQQSVFVLSLLTLCCGAQARCVNWVLSSQVMKMLVSVHTISTVSQELLPFLAVHVKEILLVYFH